MTWAGQPIGFATNAAPALLADLAVEAGRPHSYEILAVMLYSDPPPTPTCARRSRGQKGGQK